MHERPQMHMNEADIESKITKTLTLSKRSLFGVVRARFLLEFILVTKKALCFIEIWRLQSKGVGCHITCIMFDYIRHR